jgi:GrpB-like predicted nucleotidyltransferase (UPF0157 family)
MVTHPLWRPFELASDADIVAARVNAPQRGAPIDVVEPDPTWPATFAIVAARVGAVLGRRALTIAHVGSTAVAGLAAKPVIDIDVIVTDSADEQAYVPDMEAGGWVLRIREPEFEEHRLLRLEDPECNLHVWSPGSPEPRRHLAFRDWLGTHPEDRDLYAAAKRVAAARGFTDGMHYNNAKAGVVYDIYERIFAADPAHPHDPRPRTRQS